MRNLLVGTLFSSLAACSAIYETPQLTIAAGEAPEALEEAPVVLRRLDQSALPLLNTAPYQRFVIDGSDLSGAARMERAAAAIRFNPPPTVRPAPYRIGVGDTLELSRLATAERRVMTAPSSLRGSDSPSTGNLGSSAQAARGAEPALVASQAPVSEDGTVAFVETGPVQVAGRTLSEAREVILNALLRNDFNARFQVQVSDFNSQTIFLSISADGEGGTRSAIAVPATTVPLTLLELLIEAGISVPPGGDMRVRIQRGGQSYEVPLSHLYAPGSPTYFLRAGDHVRVEPLIYRPSRAFIFGAVDRPQALPLSALRRETLADALFAPGAVLSTGRARLSEIYLLRGREPAVAYHLNANNPARLKLAAQVELRPDDIIFVTERPLNSWNRIISLLGPSLSLPGRLNTVSADLAATGI